LVVPGRRAGALIAVGLLMAGSSISTIAPADAAAYRYWSYWVGAGSGWDYSDVGAATHRGDDGSVEAWRFAVSSGSNSSQTPPRTAPSFTDICGSTDAPAGKKRIGLVIDYGIDSDAPPGERPPGGIARYCVEVDTNANGARVLTRVLPVRSSSGLVCGINGYPRSECAAVVKEVPAAPKPKPTPKPSSSSPSTPAKPSSSGASGSGGSTSRSGASSGAAATDSPSGDDEVVASPGATAAPTSAAGEAPTSTPDSPATAGAAEPNGDPTADAPIEVTADQASGSNGSPIGLALTVALLAIVGGSVYLIKRRSA
jgi:hypothetical protein